MIGQITEDDQSEQPFRVKLKSGKLSWFKEVWVEARPCSVGFKLRRFLAKSEIHPSSPCLALIELLRTLRNVGRQLSLGQKKGVCQRLG